MSLLIFFSSGGKTKIKWAVWGSFLKVGKPLMLMRWVKGRNVSWSFWQVTGACSQCLFPSGWFSCLCGAVSWIKSQICLVHPMKSRCLDGHTVQHELGCSDLCRVVRAFPPGDFKILKPSGGLKLIYQTGEGKKKIHKCVWSIELPLTSKVPTMLFSSTLQQSGHPANP